MEVVWQVEKRRKRRSQVEEVKVGGAWSAGGGKAGSFPVRLEEQQDVVLLSWQDGAFSEEESEELGLE